MNSATSGNSTRGSGLRTIIGCVLGAALVVGLIDAMISNAWIFAAVGSFFSAGVALSDAAIFSLHQTLVEAGRLFLWPAGVIGLGSTCILIKKMKDAPDHNNVFCSGGNLSFIKLFFLGLLPVSCFVLIIFSLIGLDKDITQTSFHLTSTFIIFLALAGGLWKILVMLLAGKDLV